MTYRYQRALKTWSMYPKVNGWIQAINRGDADTESRFVEKMLPWAVAKTVERARYRFPQNEISEEVCREIATHSFADILKRAKKGTVRDWKLFSGSFHILSMNRLKAYVRDLGDETLEAPTRSSCMPDEVNVWENPPEEAVIWHQLEKALLNAVNELQIEDKNKEALRMRFGIGEYHAPHTLEETAGKLKISRERVRQLEGQMRKGIEQGPYFALLKEMWDGEPASGCKGDHSWTESLAGEDNSRAQSR